MIKKINIEDMGSFKDFKWDSSVRDKGNSIVELKPVNIFYGRNYSGKTTLSRILRSVETKARLAKYPNARFSLLCDNGNPINQDSLAYDKSVRVFNRDFVKDSLSFVYDDDGDIEPFSVVLGEENADIEKQIVILTDKLGSEVDKTGLYGQLTESQNELNNAKERLTTAQRKRDDELRDKARKIKETYSKYGYLNYDISNIRKNIEFLASNPDFPLAPNKKSEHEETIEEKQKDSINIPQALTVGFSNLAHQTKLLVEKEIITTKPIHELLENHRLQNWVHDGMELHHNRDTCAFCRQTLSASIWEELNNHFNQESNALIKNIETLIKDIESEKSDVLNYHDNPAFQELKYYSVFHQRLRDAINECKESSNKYGEALGKLISQLKERQNDIFKKLIFEMPQLDLSLLSDVVNNLREIIAESNEYTSKLSEKQKEAGKSLVLNEVYNFINSPDYVKKEHDVNQSESVRLEKKKGNDQKNQLVSQAKEDIKQLMLKRKHMPGTEIINRLLSSHFGQQSLSLQPDNDDKFVIKRGDEIAYNLSEGERNIIAFCYFIARLNEDTAEKNPIIWIDDPISSLDSNHIFFVYSIIDAEIVQPKRYKQLFIATHNLDFLKYLKRLSQDYQGKGDNKKKIREFFLISKQKTSTISIMPKYLEKYASEFNYLFEQIYKCAHVNENEGNNYQYFLNFANNARKFLEIYFCFIFPNIRGQDDSEKNDPFDKFFGEDSKVTQSLTKRFTNEGSHFTGRLEKASQPIDLSNEEVRNIAQQILDRIEEYDEEQYIELVKSIDGEIKNHET